MRVCVCVCVQCVCESEHVYTCVRACLCVVCVLVYMFVLFSRSVFDPNTAHYKISNSQSLIDFFICCI